MLHVEFNDPPCKELQLNIAGACATMLLAAVRPFALFSPPAGLIQLQPWFILTTRHVPFGATRFDPIS